MLEDVLRQIGQHERFVLTSHARPDGDAVLVQDRRQVVGVDLLVPEAHRAAPVGDVFGSEDRCSAVDQAVQRVAGDVLLVRADLVHAQGLEVVDRRPELG